MNTDHNLLFGVIALQAELIDASQFVEACLLWTTRKKEPLADLLVEKGWIEAADCEHIEYLLKRKVKKDQSDLHACLAAIPNNIKNLLAEIRDDDIQASIGASPSSESPGCVTIDHVPATAERYGPRRFHKSGGIGHVWVSHDRQLGRDVALKELRPEHAGHADASARFLREARITGQLEHPGIVPVYELVQSLEGGKPFYTMRFVKGSTLSDASRAFHARRRAGQSVALEFPRLLNAFVTVCNTIAYAHSRGVLHRDLKGQNVILGDFGEVIVLDWGLAKLVGRSEEEDARSIIDSPRHDDISHTVQGQAVGTPAYMAPEQAAGRLDQIDRRTDVYGLGAILYELLTGQPPFIGPDSTTVLQKVQSEAASPPREL